MSNFTRRLISKLRHCTRVAPTLRRSTSTNKLYRNSNLVSNLLSRHLELSISYMLYFARLWVVLNLSVSIKHRSVLMGSREDNPNLDLNPQAPAVAIVLVV